MKLIIDSKIRVPLDDLPRKVERELCEEFTHGNPKHFKLKRMNQFWANKEPAEIKMFTIADDELLLPRGGASRVKSILCRAGLTVSWEDRRTTGDPSAAGWCPSHMPSGEAGSSLWDHQAEMRDILAAKQQGLGRAPTGSGKTTAGIALCEAIQLPTIVIVSDNGLRKQWIKRLMKELGLKRSDIGQIGDGKFQLKPITIGMQQTLFKCTPAKWLRINEFFGCVIADEVQRFAAKTFLSVINKFTAKYRIGISADETRKDEKEFLIYDMFGKCLIDIPLQTLIDRGLVHDVRIRVHPTDFEAEWYVKARNSKKPKSPFGKQDNPDFNRLLEEMGDDDARNAIAIDIAAAECGRGNQTVLFSHRREHCMRLNSEMVKQGFASGLMLGGPKDAAEFDLTTERLKKREIVSGAGTVQAVGTGLDIPTVNRGVSVTPMFNNRQGFGQLRGRMCRIAEGKTDAIVYVLWDRHVYGVSAIKNLAKWNNVVEVWDDDHYVPAKDYLKKLKDEKTHGHPTFSPQEQNRIDRIFKSAD